MNQNFIKVKGKIRIEMIDDNENIINVYEQDNTVVNSGLTALARIIGNQLDSDEKIFIETMVFGTGGADGNIPRTVDPSMTSLYNEISSVSIISNWDSNYPNRMKFVGTVGSSSNSNGFSINEVGLKLSNGDLFSMTTFSGFLKTSSFRFALSWWIDFY